MGKHTFKIRQKSYTFYNNFASFLGLNLSHFCSILIIQGLSDWANAEHHIPLHHRKSTLKEEKKLLKEKKELYKNHYVTLSERNWYEDKKHGLQGLSYEEKKRLLRIKGMLEDHNVELFSEKEAEIIDCEINELEEQINSEHKLTIDLNDRYEDYLFALKADYNAQYGMLLSSSDVFASLSEYSLRKYWGYLSKIVQNSDNKTERMDIIIPQFLDDYLEKQANEYHITKNEYLKLLIEKEALENNFYDEYFED